MTREEANQIIEDALRPLGSAEPVEETFFLDDRFASIPWVPTYPWRVGDRVWAIELFRGDRVPEATIRAMVDTTAIEPNVQPAFFVPDGEPHELLMPICRERGIALIAKTSDQYEAFVFAVSGRPLAEPLVVRIPVWVIDELPRLANLAQGFRAALAAFCRRYRHLLASGRISDEKQEDLLRNAFLSLLRSDRRFVGEYAPLELLRLFEQSRQDNGSRDHYFHTFNNFLLGCIVINDSYRHFQTFRRSCFPGTRDWSIEYVWLLTVLFHDVGYPIQKRQETSQLIFGVPAISEEQAVAERKQAWESPTYRVSRTQLVSLHSHLMQERINSDWSPDPFPLQENHPLDTAFAHSFLKQGHGVASCMRMLSYFFQSISRWPQQRQFLARHIFVAGLSIPFHDWPVRKCLRDKGIAEISTARFPFAALLMFIDSIQEDRRGRTQSPDLLTRISVRGNTVSVDMNLDLLSTEALVEKKREAGDVKSFLREDLLRFEYPADLTR